MKPTGWLGTGDKQEFQMGCIIKKRARGVREGYQEEPVFKSRPKRMTWETARGQGRRLGPRLGWASQNGGETAVLETAAEQGYRARPSGEAGSGQTVMASASVPQKG